jgi:hypothetical protein
MRLTIDCMILAPLNRQITCVIRLVNRTNKYTVYKLKTTNPKKFSVSPKQGFLPPNQSERLEVVMNMDDGDILPTKQDKFRVEGIPLSYGSDDMKNMVDDVVRITDFLFLVQLLTHDFSSNKQMQRLLSNKQLIADLKLHQIT